MAILDPSLTPESIRASMAIPSTSTRRGLRDGVGFATTREAMAAVYAASALPPHPAPLGPEPTGPVVGAICPHDDFLYAGRVYRRALERITAKTVIVVGVFHAHRRFEASMPIFDDFTDWWAPDGPVPVSPLREWMAANRLSALRQPDRSAHEHEHSIEPIVAWLRHRRDDVEIVPILAPAASYEQFLLFGIVLIDRIFEWLKAAKMEFGRDVAIVISGDAIHYGIDFEETRFGPGNPGAHESAMAEDRRILVHDLEPDRRPPASYRVMASLVDDPWQPDAYRWTWCGRYSIPFGTVLLENAADALGARLRSWPLAYETSMSTPLLDVRMPPLGLTAPASFEHFVGYPAVAFTFESIAPAART